MVGFKSFPRAWNYQIKQTNDKYILNMILQTIKNVILIKIIYKPHFTHYNTELVIINQYLRNLFIQCTHIFYLNK